MYVDIYNNVFYFLFGKTPNLPPLPNPVLAEIVFEPPGITCFAYQKYLLRFSKWHTLETS